MQVRLRVLSVECEQSVLYCVETCKKAECEKVETCLYWKMPLVVGKLTSEC